ncbi:lipoyl protein ligase domain-containing protein [Nibricoccus sp. IMCC34717]|uniref:lipoyl protein ligase domain-containing protein n=1 Tax=Nibricoccus sp. IMCC34717 TaxID=3034021 RepID=UPI0038512E74
MSWRLDHLPHRSGGAAENMAADFLLLKRYPNSEYARVRHYGWHRPAFTFGYSQRIDWVRGQLPPDEAVELCRRPTGGGVVDHRSDWTYALVIPPAHPLCDLPAPKSYRAVHALIADLLAAAGEPVELKQSCEPAADGECEAGPTVCFKKPELYDVLRRDDGRKVAGAAQKRTKQGLLFQGSLSRAALSPGFDWDGFETQWVAGLARLLEAEAYDTGWPDFREGEWEALTEQYASEEWNCTR